MKNHKPNPELKFTKMVGKRVAKRRRKLRLTQHELALKAGAGLYRQLVGRLENGEQMPSIFQLQALADALEVPLTHLVDKQKSSGTVGTTDTPSVPVPSSRQSLGGLD